MHLLISHEHTTKRTAYKLKKNLTRFIGRHGINDVAQDYNKWRNIMNTLINIRFLQKVREFLDGWSTITLCSKTELRKCKRKFRLTIIQYERHDSGERKSET
jgi:hypothetical protein